MSIETALKNYTLEAVIKDAGSGLFEDIWRKSLTDYRNSTGRQQHREAWEKRLRLRREIDGIIYDYRQRDVIGHFRDSNKDVPIWAIFEVMTLGNFGSFFDCLDIRVKREITHDLGMPSNMDAERLLKAIIFALKDFRNAIAHNGVILDVRFQSGSINTRITELIKQETGVSGVDFKSITDYVVLLAYLMRRMGFTKTECRQLIANYEAILEHFYKELPFNIYSRLISTTTRNKLAKLRSFVSNS